MFLYRLRRAVALGAILGWIVVGLILMAASCDDHGQHGLMPSPPPMGGL